MSIKRDPHRKYNEGRNGGDPNVVRNIRFTHKDKVAEWSDEMIAQAWGDFSLSDDYYAADQDAAFLTWLSDYDKA